MRTSRLPGLLTASCALLLLLAPALPARAQDDDEAPGREELDPAEQMREDIRKAQEQMSQDYGAAVQQQQEAWTKISAEMAAQYDDYARKMEEQRQWLKKKVERQWSDFHESTSKEWVDYGAKGDSMSQVDFEKGKIEVEVLVPVEEVAPKKKVADAGELDAKERAKLQALAEDKIRAQTKKVLAQKGDGGAPVLKDQVKAPDGKAVTEKSVDKLVKGLEPKMQVEPKPVVAQDGKPRLKVKVEIPMVPEHLKVRAARYSQQVDAAAKKYDLDPALIYAVIHTESCFNPMAKSKVGALGLMQLVPKTAAFDAYKYLYKRDKLITPEYLYNPDNNIALGSTYLHMLRDLQYGKLKSMENRQTMSIAAYNCGAGNMKKAITSRYDVDTLSNSELVGLIRKFAPRETADYVPAVQKRMELYRSL